MVILTSVFDKSFYYLAKNFVSNQVRVYRSAKVTAGDLSFKFHYVHQLEYTSFLAQLLSCAHKQQRGLISSDCL